MQGSVSGSTAVKKDGSFAREEKKTVLLLHEDLCTDMLQCKKGVTFLKKEIDFLNSIT